jgi:hypothetical protein
MIDFKETLMSFPKDYERYCNLRDNLKLNKNLEMEGCKNCFEKREKID